MTDRTMVWRLNDVAQAGGRAEKVPHARLVISTESGQEEIQAVEGRLPHLFA